MSPITPQQLSQQLISKMFINPSETTVKSVENEFSKIHNKMCLFLTYGKEDDFYEYMCIEENVKNINEAFVQDVYEDNISSSKRRYSEQRYLQTRNRKHNIYFEMKDAILEIFENNL